MSTHNNVIVQFVGFEAKSQGREYTLRCAKPLPSPVNIL